jgi:threonine dehydrogenase-like Zn-dependent dehydrogenase
MEKKMRSAVFLGPKVVEVQFTNIPEPKENQVRIKLEGCGVCSSNLPVFEGRPWFNYPIEAGSPGHEGWGIVDALGKGVKNLSLGDRVAALSFHAYAEYDIAQADCVVPLPDSLNGKPFPGEPLGCSINIFKRSDIKKGETVAILGIGFLGAILTEMAAKEGARVIAISKRESSLLTAKNMGASETILMDDHYKIIEQVKSLTGGEFCDRVIEATGKQWPLDLAGELTKIKGKLIIAGYHQDGMRQVNMQLWNWRGLDVINAHERDEKLYIQGISEAIGAVEQERLNPFPLFTHLYRLEQICQALDAAERREDGFIKALVKL